MGAVGKVRLLPFPYQRLLLCPLLRMLGVAAPGMTLRATSWVSLGHCRPRYRRVTRAAATNLVGFEETVEVPFPQRLDWSRLECDQFV